MSAYKTRRATVEDLAQLSALWKSAKLPASDLEKQFTQFQVAEDDQGKIVAAIGLHIEGSSGKIHSESFADFGQTDVLRPVLWERLQVVAQNHGLFRFWTEEAAPWWKKSAGFSSPSGEILQKLPAVYGLPDAGWLTLRLKDELADPEEIEKQIATFKEAERIRREKIIYRGQIIKIIGTVISALLFLFAFGVLFYFLKHRR